MTEDMNLSPRWVGVLVDAGIESVHWSVLGAHDATNSQIMPHARTNDYVVLTTVKPVAPSPRIPLRCAMD